ncbi:hypothetical protein C9374_008106 [Naegleria lovaniensis]|uniref:Uncharacterized protein n=1 Tax=Naegleria lovaniensis TaxID=51637 RepID=A0AA88GJF3_NAELO|nr:uncharacterized protein C9374_008106 [Naegleria lovaniensis]KAG2378467.1 hypothetical protein C9374_008106 [Naegleria lovaniensis]
MNILKSFGIEHGKAIKLQKKDSFRILSRNILTNYLMDQKKTKRIYWQQGFVKNAKPMKTSLKQLRLAFVTNSDHVTFVKLMVTSLLEKTLVHDSSKLLTESQYSYSKQIVLPTLKCNNSKTVIQNLRLTIDVVTEKETIKVSPVDNDSIFESNCFIIVFNRMQRSSWQNIMDHAVRFVRNHSIKEKPMILVGMNWSPLFHQKNRMNHFLHARVVKGSNDFVTNDEILQFCKKNGNVLAFVDAKPHSDGDLNDVMNHIVKSTLYSDWLSGFSDLELQTFTSNL